MFLTGVGQSQPMNHQQSIPALTVNGHANPDWGLMSRTRADNRRDVQLCRHQKWWTTMDLPVTWATVIENVNIIWRIPLYSEFEGTLWLWDMDPACWLWKWIQLFKTKSLRKLLHISYLEHKTNDWVHGRINFLVDPKGTSSGNCQRQKFTRFGHVKRHSSLSKTILQGTLESGQCHGRHRKCWMDNVKSLSMPEWPGIASHRKSCWKSISAESSLTSSQWQNQSRDWTEPMEKFPQLWKQPWGGSTLVY